MKYLLVAGLVSLFHVAAVDDSAPAGWKIIKDAKRACQISVPADWDPSADSAGAAIFHDATTAIAVVTSQPGQTVNPFPGSLLKSLRIPKEKMFENTAKRIFYQDKIALNAHDSNSFSAMVPGRNGTCSSRVVFSAPVSEETARKITLTLGPAPSKSADQRVE